MDVRWFHKRLSDVALRLIPREATLVCAVSGGADSVALLHGLLKVNEIHCCAWRVHVAHLDHGLREEAAADAAFVREVCAALSVGCTLDSARVRGESERRGETIEESARRLRYAFLERVSREIGARVVAVGHHLDDQAETVLHHIVRGTGIRGLAGMRECRAMSMGSDVMLVRPMLGLSREEIRQYLDARSLVFRDDKTNADSEMSTRNAIRHVVLPLLRERVNPEIASALTRLAMQARQVEAALVEIAEPTLNHAIIHRTERVFVLSVEALTSWPEAIQAEMLRIVLNRLDAGMRDLGAERMASLLGLLTVDGSKRRIELPGRFVAERRGSELRIEEEIL